MMMRNLAMEICVLETIVLDGKIPRIQEISCSFPVTSAELGVNRNLPKWIQTAEKIKKNNLIAVLTFPYSIRKTKVMSSHTL